MIPFKNLLVSLIFLTMALPGFSQVKIGEQVWMSANLDVDRFRNGDPIPEARTPEEWRQAERNRQPAWCYCASDPGNRAKYGKFYNWYAVHDPRGLAPKGWRVPSNEDWDKLNNFLGGNSVSGGKLRAMSDWISGGPASSNSSGFSAYPPGFRTPGGTCEYWGFVAYWWTSTVDAEYGAWYAAVSYDNNNLNCSPVGGGGPDTYEKGTGYSVRCIRE